MAYGREVNSVNSRGYDQTVYEEAHLNLTMLKEYNPKHPYLWKKNIPLYPKYVFEVSNVCHVTEKSGLYGIFEDQGFRGSDSDRFLWWGLSMRDHSQELSSPNQIPFLEEFATSPAFQTKSRYGNFRFTFTLTELLNAYSNQFCHKTSPILRVLGTTLYKKEIVYSVLVHPRDMWHYRKYPRLPVDGNKLCRYSQKRMFWQCQSPSDNYEYCLEVNNEDGEQYASPLRRTKYFVWDNVALAFHMKRNWVLRLGRRRLFEHLSVCETSSNALLKEPPMSVDEAKEEVEKLRTMDWY